MLSNLANAIQMSLRQNYDLTIESAKPIGTGAMSTTMQLATNQGTLFLKIYKSARNQKTATQLNLQRIAFTHTVQDFLYREGFPVPRLLPNNSGETFSVCATPLEAGEVYALSEFIEGSDYDVANSEQLRASGEMLGRLHQQLRRFQSQIQPAGSSLESELFIQLEARLSRLQPITEKDPSHRPKSIHGLMRLGFSKVQSAQHTMRNPNKVGSYMAITAPKTSSLMTVVSVQFLIWIPLVPGPACTTWDMHWSFSLPFIKIFP